MTYSAKSRALATKAAEARRKKRGQTQPKGDTIKPGPRSRAGNAQNVASLTAGQRNTKRREVLRFVGAISRGQRIRKNLIEALRTAKTPEGAAVQSRETPPPEPTKGAP